MSFPYLLLGNLAETLPEAKKYYEESLASATKTEDRWGMVAAVSNLALTALEMDDQKEA